MCRYQQKDDVSSNRRSGFALVLTIVVLVALTAIVYRLGSTLSTQNRRQQYIIDYQNARYGCDSTMKYALDAIGEAAFTLVQRPNEPDFSDLFNLDEAEYKEFIADWILDNPDGTVYTGTSEKDIINITAPRYLADSNEYEYDNIADSRIDVDDFNEANDVNEYAADFNNITNDELVFVRGPYGPVWPYVQEPLQLELGSAQVTVEIEDENAKMPLTWGIADTNDKELSREYEAALVTFCEWMRMEPNEIEPLQGQLNDIKEIKTFSIKLKPVTTIKTVKPKPAPKKRESKRARRRRSRSKRPRQIKSKRPQVGHTRDFARLMHSSMLDREALARPFVAAGQKKEAPVKYLSLWGTQRVNINTAPRPALEAAFTFGGVSEAIEIAEKIIQKRQKKPFRTIDDLNKALVKHNESIKKSEPYLTTESGFFTIKVTSVSGTAKVTAMAAVRKVDGKLVKIGIISN